MTEDRPTRAEAERDAFVPTEGNDGLLSLLDTVLAAEQGIQEFFHPEDDEEAADDFTLLLLSVDHHQEALIRLQGGWQRQILELREQGVISDPDQARVTANIEAWAGYADDEEPF